MIEGLRPLFFRGHVFGHVEGENRGKSGKVEDGEEADFPRFTRFCPLKNQ